MKIFILNIIDVNGVLFNFHGNTVKELEKAWRDFKSDVPTLEGITIKINEKEKTIQIFDGAYAAEYYALKIYEDNLLPVEFTNEFFKYAYIPEKITHGQFGNGLFFSTFKSLTFIHGTDVEVMEEVIASFMNPETEQQPETYEEFVGCCFHLMQQLGGLLLVTACGSDFNSQFITAIEMEDTSGAPLDLKTKVMCSNTVFTLEEIISEKE